MNLFFMLLHAIGIIGVGTGSVLFERWRRTRVKRWHWYPVSVLGISFALSCLEALLPPPWFYENGIVYRLIATTILLGFGAILGFGIGVWFMTLGQPLTQVLVDTGRGFPFRDGNCELRPNDWKYQLHCRAYRRFPWLFEKSEKEKKVLALEAAKEAK